MSSDEQVDLPLALLRKHPIAIVRTKQKISVKLSFCFSFVFFWTFKRKMIRIVSPPELNEEKTLGVHARSEHITVQQSNEMFFRSQTTDFFVFSVPFKLK